MNHSMFILFLGTRIRIILLMMLILTVNLTPLKAQFSSQFIIGLHEFKPLSSSSDFGKSGNGLHIGMCYRFLGKPWSIGLSSSLTTFSIDGRDLNYVHNGVPVIATLENEPLSVDYYLTLQRSFTPFESYQGLKFYVQGGIGLYHFNNHIRIYSDVEYEYTTDNVETIDIIVSPTQPTQVDYDNCVPVTDNAPEIIVTTVSTTPTTTTYLVREYYEVKDKIKSISMAYCLETGMSLRLIPFDLMNEDAGLYLNGSLGVVTANNVTFLDITHKDPTHSTSHRHHNESYYETSFKNLNTGEVHSHPIGTRYTQKLQGLKFQIGISLRF